MSEPDMTLYQTVAAAHPDWSDVAVQAEVAALERGVVAGWFTWDDVDELQCAADDLRDWAGASYTGEGSDDDARALLWPADDLTSLADRIAALLPPREDGKS